MSKATYLDVALRKKHIITNVRYLYLVRTHDYRSIFFNVGSPKEDIFSGHLLSPIFQSTLHITSLCLGVDADS